jgi:putative peptidoglycan lipid II flippase
MKRKITSTIAGATALLTIFGFLGKLMGLARESLFADYFGLSSDYDLYLIAVVLPISINSIILYITQNYFIPNYHTIKAESLREANTFSNTTFWMFSISGLVITLILFQLSESILKFYLQSDNVILINRTLVIFRIFIFTIPLNTLFAVFASLLQAELRFKYPIFSQLLLNSVVIVIVLFFNGQLKIISIPIGYLAGTFLQVLYLYFKVKKFLIPNFKKFFSSNKFAFFGSTFLLLVIIEILGQSYSIIDRYFFEQIDDGGIAALNYAFILFNLPITIIAFALTTVLFPTLSRLSGEKSFEEISIHLKNFFSVNIFIFIPISFVLICYGDLFVKIIFEHGKFDQRATSLTYNALILYSLSYIFLSSYFVLNKLFYSIQKIKYLFIITISGILLKIILSFQLVPSYKHDGLALSTSFTYLFFFSVSYLVIFSWLKFKNGSTFLVELLFSGFNGLLSYYLVYLCRVQLIVRTELIIDIINFVLFLIFYLTNAYLIKHNSVLLILDIINRITGTSLKTVKKWTN